MTPARTLAFWTLSACIAGLSACATSPAAPVCANDEVRPEQLVGQWRVDLAGQSAPLTLLLRPHPEHAGSLRGTLMQNPQHFAVVADLEDGEFTMEESHDGQRIAATWLGQVQPGSCGQAIEGERQEGATGPRLRFRMGSDRLR
ncbi:MAG: hypothetical protein ACOYB1_15625 [Limnohabitans sp.]